MFCRCPRLRTSSAFFDNDEGPNTGGMGAYTPLPWLPEGFVQEVGRRLPARPWLVWLSAVPLFVGVLFAAWP